MRALPTPASPFCLILPTPLLPDPACPPLPSWLPPPPPSPRMHSSTGPGPRAGNVCRALNSHPYWKVPRPFPQGTSLKPYSSYKLTGHLGGGWGGVHHYLLHHEDRRPRRVKEMNQGRILLVGLDRGVGDLLPIPPRTVVVG